jgi:hypothetical protein
MNAALKSLVDAARKVEMSKEEREAQRRSFAFGNTHFENPLITREMIDRAADKLAAEKNGNPDDGNG